MVVQWCSIVWDAPTLVISSHFEFEAMLIFSSNFLRMLTQLIQQFLFFPFFFSYFCLHFLLSHNWEKKGSIRYSIGTCHNFFHAMIMSKTGKQTYIWHQENVNVWHCILTYSRHWRKIKSLWILLLQKV